MKHTLPEILCLIPTAFGVGVLLALFLFGDKL